MAEEGSGTPARLILQPDDSVITSAQAAIAFGANVIAREQPGAIAGEEEPIHQLRVGIRRLRASLFLFKNVIHGTHFESFQRDLPWVSKAAGTVRECDIIESLLRSRASKLDTPLANNLTLLYDALGERRRTAHTNLTAIFASNRYRNLMTRLGAPRLKNAGTLGTLGPSTAQMLLPMVRAVKRAGTGVDEHSPPEVLHRLRVRIKRLRYALEMLDKLGGKACKKTINQLEKLQTAAGEFTDVVAAIAWLRTFADSPAAPASALLAAGAMIQSLNRRQQKLAARFLKNWHRFERKDLLSAVLDETRDSAQQAPQPESAGVPAS
ncbi:MAG TPA: CHAD domain-containing protein [Candidatus Binataceae bacterium]